MLRGVEMGSANRRLAIFVESSVSSNYHSLILLQHYKSNTFIEDFVGRARVGRVILEEPTDVTSQVVKSTKQSLLLCTS